MCNLKCTYNSHSRVWLRSNLNNYPGSLLIRKIIRKRYILQVCIFYFLIFFHTNNLVEPKMNWLTTNEPEEDPQTSDEWMAPVDTLISVMWDLVTGWIVSVPKFIYVKALTPSTSECGCIWGYVLERGNKVKMRLLGWPLVQGDWCHKKRKFGHSERHQGSTCQEKSPFADTEKTRIQLSPAWASDLQKLWDN